MHFFIKLIISLGIIIFCSQIGRKLPTLAGLIATMPLTGAIVLVWLYLDNPANRSLMRDYTRGALWGIGPSIAFFVTAYICFRRQLNFTVVLSASFAVWVVGAIIHQWFLSK